MLGYGVDGALTLAAESDLEEQQPTPRAPLDCLTPTLEAKLIVGDVGQESGRRKRRNLPRIDNGDGGSRCWQAAREKICCHTPRSLAAVLRPWSMLFTKATILLACLGDVSPLGAAASRLRAAAGVSSDLTGGLKAPCPKPKLPKTEADTVLSVDLL